jgi:hypothetical protein
MNKGSKASPALLSHSPSQDEKGIEDFKPNILHMPPRSDMAILRLSLVPLYIPLLDL